MFSHLRYYSYNKPPTNNTRFISPEKLTPPPQKVTNPANLKAFFAP